MTSIALSQERLNAIAEEIAARLLEQHYFEQGVVTGEQLKTFTQHPQINKFLLFQVYQVWSMQVSRLRHPYFEFDHSHIQQTLTHLQNLLSQHIAIRSEDFRPLLIQAVFNTLRLTLQPAEAFSDFFFTGGDRLPLGTFAKYVPFFTDFDFAVGSIMAYCQKNGIETIDKDIFRAKFDKVIALYNARQEGGIDGYRSKILGNLTDHTLVSLAQEAEQEAITRTEAERQSQIAMQEEAERQRRAAEEAQRQEEIRRQAEAEREAHERARAEAEAQRARQSFFDTLEVPVQAAFELSDEPDAEQPAPAPEPVQEPAPEPEIPAFVPEPQAVSVTWDSSIQVVDDDDDAGQWVIEEEPETVSQPEPEPEPEVQTRSLGETPVVQTRSLFGGLDGLQHAAAPASGETLTFAEDKPAEETPTVEVTPELNHQPSGFSPLEMPAFTPEAEPGTAQETPAEPAPAPEPTVQEVAATEPAPQPERPLTLAERLRQQAQGSNPATPPPAATPADTQIRLDGIPIHKQYQFVKKVFGGNNVRFRIIVDKINAATTREEVEETLQKFVFTAPEVDQTDAVVEEFVVLMRGRFS